jgi:hypothetical protein
MEAYLPRLLTTTPAATLSTFSMRLLGSSMAKFYGIGSLGEARAYLAHPRLGPRLDRAQNLAGRCIGAAGEFRSLLGDAG